MAFGVTVLASLVSRNLIAVVVSSVIVAGALFVVVVNSYGVIAPYDRVTVPVQQWYSQMYGSDKVDNGDDGVADTGAGLDAGDRGAPGLDEENYTIRAGFLDARGIPLQNPWQLESGCWDTAAAHAAAVLGVDLESTVSGDLEAWANWDRVYGDRYVGCLADGGAVDAYSDVLPVRALWTTRGLCFGLLAGGGALLASMAAAFMRRSIARR